jgi:limonene-1,2-epoxide hydrolase
MPELSNREIVERFAASVKERDYEAALFLLADDMVEDYPQSGERISGLDNWLAMLQNWPEAERLESEVDLVIGNEDQWVVSPSWALTRIVGTGDHFWATGHVTYPDGSRWHLIQLFEVHRGKITKMQSYFAEPFPAPDWRKPYVTQMPAGER